ncbi:MAG: hypothetical protein H6R14_1519 [Proteobacteria bacterium]|nr:hypothetical protein [Pseudomonadota bacterium]
MRTLNRIKLGLSLLAIAFSTPSALAASDWRINPQGNGVTDASTVSTLGVGGVGYIQIQPDALTPGQYSFIEHGAYQAYAPNSTAPFPGHEITITYSVLGTSNLGDPAALRMTGGRIDLYSDAGGDFGTYAPNYGADNGTHFGSFNIVSGYVANRQGQVIVNAQGISGSFAPGFLFNSDGVDLANLPNIQLQLALYNQQIQPDGPIIAGVICGIANACAANRLAQSQTSLTVQDTGSVSISAVPEPLAPAMWLLGLGLIGGIARRRR